MPEDGFNPEAFVERMNTDLKGKMRIEQWGCEYYIVQVRRAAGDAERDDPVLSGWYDWMPAGELRRFGFTHEAVEKAHAIKRDVSTVADSRVVRVIETREVVG